MLLAQTANIIRGICKDDKEVGTSKSLVCIATCFSKPSLAKICPNLGMVIKQTSVVVAIR